jgi:hypothetical protein
MNSYFFKMTNEEKNSILDQHKSLYDGYVTQNNNSKEQPLYVQDFANDKAGITVNNKGEVGEYRNMRINEMRHDGKSTGLFDEDAQSGSESIPSNTFEDDSYMVSVGEQLDMIGDRKDDLEHGTFDDVDDEEFEKMDREEYLRIQDECPNCDGFGTVDGDSEYSIDGVEDCEICGGTGKRSQIDSPFHDFRDELESDVFESLQEQLNKTLDMFKRFNTY